MSLCIIQCSIANCTSLNIFIGASYFLHKPRKYKLLKAIFQRFGLKKSIDIIYYCAQNLIEILKWNIFNQICLISIKVTSLCLDTFMQTAFPVLEIFLALDLCFRLQSSQWTFLIVSTNSKRFISLQKSNFRKSLRTISGQYSAFGTLVLFVELLW